MTAFAGNIAVDGNDSSADIFKIENPTPGTGKTLSLTYAGEVQEGPSGFLVYLDDAEEADVDLVVWESGPQTLTLDSQSDGLVFGVLYAFTDFDATPSGSGQTLLDDFTNNFGYAALVQEDTPGSSSTELSASASFAAWMGISVVPASGGANEATIAATWAELEGSALVTVANPVTSAVGATWPELAALAACLETNPCTVVAAWAAWVCSASVTVANPVDATIAAEWSEWAGAATLLETNPCTVVAEWAEWDGATTLLETIPSTVAATWAEWDGATTLLESNPCTVVAAWAAWVADASASSTSNITSAIAATWPELAALATCLETNPCTVQGDWVAWAGAATLLEAIPASAEPEWSEWAGSASLLESLPCTVVADWAELVCSGSVLVQIDVASTIAATWPAWAALASCETSIVGVNRKRGKMSVIKQGYSGSTPGSSEEHVLWSSYVAFNGSANHLQTYSIARFVLDIVHDEDGTLYEEKSDDGATWYPVSEEAITASATTSTAREYSVEAYRHWRLKWENGAAAQTTWEVDMSLTTEV
jgi:hypothetical protein